MSKQENTKSTKSLFTPADTIAHSLCLYITHTLCLCSHTPTTKHACLLLVLHWLDSPRTKSLFWAETFLRESVRLCHPQEGSPRHADPTGDSGLLSSSLTTVSHNLWFYTASSGACGDTHFCSTLENLWLGRRSAHRCWWTEVGFRILEQVCVFLLVHVVIISSVPI